MTRIPRIPALALAAVLLATGACSDDRDPATPVEAPSGSLAFTYSGARSGTFAATGQFGAYRGGGFEWRPFAVGLRYFDAVVNRRVIDLFSISPVSDSRANAVDLFIDDVDSPRSLSLDLEACVVNRETLEVREGCAVGIVSFNSSPVSGGGDFWLTSTGTLQVESVSAERIRGTFSGTLTNETGAVLTVSGGTFDVPLVDQNTGPSSSRAPAAGSTLRTQMRAAAATIAAGRE